VKGELIVTAPKTARSRRTLPLSEPVVTLLEAQRTEQTEYRIRAANVWEENGFVFTTESGRPIDPSTLLREIKRAARKAGLFSVTVHTL
jgi:integrase